MSAWGTSRLVPEVLCALIVACVPLRAVPGDADNAQDYPGFPRQPGFLITDYAEDNPAEADFPVARPLPLDAGHVDSVRIRGHRFVIRYQLGTGAPPTVYQTQLYYEKLAAAGGFQIAKSGAIGDVTETFCRAMAGHDIWVYLEPSNDINVLTVVEAPLGSTPIPAAQPAVVAPPAVVPSDTAPVEAVPPTRTPLPTNRVTTITTTSPAAPATPKVTPVPAKPEASATPSPAANPPSEDATDTDGQALYTSLLGQGRIVVPFIFQPGKDEVDPSSQVLVDRIAAMMKKHPDLFLRIEGHTDNTGDPEDNMRLSTRRAYAVRGELIDAKIDGTRIDAVGVGGLQPLADNATADGREKNRRIELVLWKRHSHGEAAPASGTNTQG